MNTTSLRTIHRNHTSHAVSDRRGSVLVVVLALLSALMLLGFLFFTLASQERENARYFTASEKFYGAQLSPDELCDFALEQVIVGPQDDLVNSALWGGRYSLLAGLVGDDLQPYSGRGVNVIQGGVPGLPAVDQGWDGTPDGMDTFPSGGDQFDDRLILDMAALATDPGMPINALRSYVDAAGNPVNGFFGRAAAPDVSYSYPDMNSPFLAFISKEPVTGQTVIIPSFHRPQYLRGMFNNPGLPPGLMVPPSQWYTDPRTSRYVMRPHASRHIRVFNYGAGTIEDTGLPRFVDPSVTAGMQEGVWTWDGMSAINDVYDADPDDDGVAEAIYMDLDHPIEETPDGTQKFIPLFAITIYDLDALLNLNAHGNVYGDLNPGDLAGMPNGTGLGPFHLLSRSNEGRHKSEINAQYGLLTGPPGTAVPGGSDTSQIVNFFEDPVDSEIELANREWWFVLAGRGQLDGPLSTGGKPTQLYPGRWGEADMLNTALTAPSRNPYDYPRPGKANSDEGAGVGDGNRGLAFFDYVGALFPKNIVFPAPVNPEDHYGRGTFVTGDGKTPLLSPNTALGRVVVPLYQQYWFPPATINVGQYWIDPLWAYALGGFPPGGLVTPVTAGLFALNGFYVDDPGETLIDPELARNQITDSIFRADETAFLFASDNDIKNNGLVSRLLNLVPANFKSADDRAERRKRFTTVSSDPKAYSFSTPVNAARTTWEVAKPDPAFPAAATFPPRWFGLGSAPWEQTGGTPWPPGDPRRAGMPNSQEPLRLELRGLLGSQPDAVAGYSQLKRLTRKLSVNHVASLTVGNDGAPRYLLRPLTPHPFGRSASGAANLSAQQVTPPPGANFQMSDYELYVLETSDNDLTDGYLPSTIPTIDHDGNAGTPPIPSPPLQEWHARRDRQNLARDIYTLLYLISDSSGANVITTNPYTQGQLFEMAQFAVNLVDAMDADDTITCFTFDLDISSAGTGWNQDGDGYSNPVTTLGARDSGIDEDGDGTAGNEKLHYVDTNRGMVYGVEAQKLVFSEAMAVLAKQYRTSPSDSTTKKDYKATDWNDDENRDFTYVELQNMTPGQIMMRGGWSIVCQYSTFTARAVTLNDPATPVGIGSGRAGLLTIGTAGDAHNTGNPPRTAPSTGRTPWSYSTPDAVSLRPSHISIDVDGSADADPPAFSDFQQIAPVAPAPDPDTTALDYDLMQREDSAATRNTFRMTEVDAVTDPSRDTAAFGGVNADDVVTAAPTAPKAGGWLNLGPNGNRYDDISESPTTTVTFYLRRRLNLNRESPAESYGTIAYDAGSVPVDPNVERDNPWVIVDTMTVPLQVFNLGGSDISTQLADLKANQRTETLSNIDFVCPDYGSTTYADFNNLGDAATASMSVWQRHFDRSFASLADVLMVPLYGPREVTEANISGGVNSRVPSDPRQTAAVKFLFPESEPRTAIAPGTAVPGVVAPVSVNAGVIGNLWYRLFEFVEIPQKFGDQDGFPWFTHYAGPSGWQSDPSQRQPWLRERLRLRDFGRLNLNTMRHPQALAGLLDDPRVFSFANTPLTATPGSGYLASANTEQWTVNGSPFGRDWWTSMLFSRDGGFDPYSFSNYGTNLILPGVPSAKPFLDFGSAPAFSTMDDIRADFNRTLLRSLPGDQATTLGAPLAPGRRSLFELGVPGSVLGSDVSTAFTHPEFSTRYRLLGKVLNHATTRSNTYVAFIQTDFFEATDPVDHDGNPNTEPISQIGAKLADSPAYRGVFVIDRSLALEMLKRRDLPPTDPRAIYPQGSKYRTYSFAREGGSDGRPTPTFDWKKLILYRRILDAQ